MTLAAVQRHKAAEEQARKTRGLLSWLGFGFVALLAIMFMAYERTTVPTGFEARAAFERLVDTAAENRVYGLDGKVNIRRNLTLVGNVECRVHTDRRSDRAYDYDCIAAVEDESFCRGFIPFYIETSSIGLISRPVSHDAAMEILRQVQFQDGTDCRS